MLGELHLGEIAFPDGLNRQGDDAAVDGGNQIVYLDKSIFAYVRFVGITHFTRL